MCVRRAERRAPAWAAPLRGGSQGVDVDGGRLFCVHELLPGPVMGRRYVHRLVLFDAEHRLVAASPRFTFAGDDVEYCAGMALHAAEMRREYTRAGLDLADLDPDPIRQFARWFNDAQMAGALEPNAMMLATASPDGIPSARIVLLKGFDERGFVFYSNYESPKGRDLETNPRAALTFFWPELERAGATLMRLKELEAIKDIAERIDEVRLVVGSDGLDKLLPAQLLGAHPPKNDTT